MIKARRLPTKGEVAVEPEVAEAGGTELLLPLLEMKAVAVVEAMTEVGAGEEAEVEVDAVVEIKAQPMV